MLRFLVFITFLFILACAPPHKRADIVVPEGIILDNELESRKKIRYYDPPSEITEESTSLIRTSSFPEVKIALLVPLSGKYAKLGQNMLDSAQMALFRLNEPNLILVPIDTEGTAFGAAEAAKKALSSDVKLILGPIFSASAKAVIPIVRDSEVNVISFSNNNSLAESGIFTIGHMPEQQIKRVVNFAMARGIEEFATIMPNNAFGAAAGKEMRVSVSENEAASVLKTEFYRLNNSGNPIKLSRHVYSAFQALMLNKPPKDYDQELEVFNENPIKFPRGLIIGESGKNLNKISGLLKLYKIDDEKIKLLGNSSWYNENSLKNQTLNGAWFAATPKARKELFEDNFAQIYDYRPNSIASLAYDGIALASTLARISNGADFSAGAITNPRGFVGIDGIFKLKTNGLAERGLAVIEISEGSFNIISPSPESFFDVVEEEAHQENEEYF